MAGLAFERNGQAIELADDTEIRRGDTPPPGELGTADDGNPFGRIFTSYANGEVFDSADPAETDFEAMLKRDGKARSVEQVLTLPLRWAELSVVPQEGDRGEAEFVREVLTTPANAGGMSTPLELVVGQMASAVTYRRAFFEKVFDIQDGRVVYKKLAFRPARTCTLIRDADSRAFKGFKQKARKGDGTTEDVVIAPEKAFVYLHAQHRDPLRGASDMDTVWSCFESKQKVRFLWFQFLERNVIPYGILKTKEADRAKRVKEVAKLKSGGVVGLDIEEELAPFQAAGDAAGIFKDAMDFLSAEMSQSVLASFTDLASQGSGRGSYALSSDQSDFFLQSRTAVLNEMGASLTGWAAADLVAWNFGPDGRAPFIRLTLVREAQEAVLELFKQLAGQAQPNQRIPNEFLDLLTEKVASVIGVDVDKVRKAIESRAATDGEPGQALRAGIDAAARLVEEAGITPTAG